LYRRIENKADFSGRSTASALGMTGRASFSADCKAVLVYGASARVKPCSDTKLKLAYLWSATRV
jgi:hypothetical protein